jgi:hypothetical protein
MKIRLATSIRDNAEVDRPRSIPDNNPIVPKKRSRFRDNQSVQAFSDWQYRER